MGNNVTGGMSRDEACASSASFLASMGAYGEDVSAYGCAYLKDGRLTFRLSDDASIIYRFTKECVQHDLYPSRVCHYIRREIISGGMREEMAYQIKLALARQLQLEYPRCFFEALDQLAQTQATDAAYGLLVQMADAIDGYFDSAELQLFEGTLEMAYGAKLLRTESHERLCRWLDKTRRQMESNTTRQASLSRTMYGYCWQMPNGDIRTVVNAQEINLRQKYQADQLSGKLLAPVLQKTYWLKSMEQIADARQEFHEYVRALQSPEYFSLLQAIKQCPSAIERNIFDRLQNEIADTGKEKALEDFKAYGRRWNLNV